MKKFLFVLTIASAMILASCSNKSATYVIAEDDAEYVANVYGSNDFFEPVPGTYTITAKKNVLSTTIDLRIVKKYDDPSYIVEHFIFEPLDKEEKHIKIGKNEVEFTAENLAEAYDGLVKASIGDVVKVKFVCALADDKQAQEVMESCASCEIGLYVEEPEEDDIMAALERDILEAEADLDEDEDIEASNSSEDWDAILDSYEKYMDQYISVVKKVNAGDVSAYSEMTSLLEELNELNEKLSSASDDMSAAQATRFQKIAAKMAAAAQM